MKNMQKIAELREKAIRDEDAVYRKGLQDESEKIIKNMIEANIDIEIISKVTGVPKEEINKK